MVVGPSTIMNTFTIRWVDVRRKLSYYCRITSLLHVPTMISVMIYPTVPLGPWAQYYSAIELRVSGIQA